MVQRKVIAVAVVLILAIAAIGGGVLLLGSEGEEKKGLYRLDATISNVNMGQCSATPGVILTLEQMYSDFYGELVDDTLTIEDARNDSEFWSEYGQWESIITKNEDGTFTMTSTTKANGDETVIVPVVDGVMSLGTMYTETMYFLACMMYGVEPYSEEGLNNEDVGNYLRSQIVGGMDYGYYETNNVEYMLSYINKDSYIDLGTNSVQSIEKEKLMQGLRDASENGTKDIVYFASGTRITADYYNNNVDPCKQTGTSYAFFGPSTLPEVFSAIECIGNITGFDEETINALIENIQLRMYKIYYSVQEKTEGQPVKYAYWEAAKGTAISSSMGKIIVEYLGFDASLLDGAEHDIESLLQDKPAYIIFYTNDSRSDDEKMRINA